MRLVWIAIFVALSGAAVSGQTPPPSPNLSQRTCASPAQDAAKQPPNPACVTSQPAPSAAEQFPYPGEPPSSAPATVQPSKAPGDPAKLFPYPGEGDSSSSRDSSSSSSRSGNDDASSGDVPKPAVGRRRLPKVQQLQSAEEREGEDLDVAKYYLQAGNPPAAYLRAKDAVHLQPSDSEAHYALAEAAQRLGKKDEAITEFAAYLKLDPDGDKVKNVRKALNSLK